MRFAANFTITVMERTDVAAVEDTDARSPETPAPRGTVAVFYGTGEGVTGGPISLTIAGIPAELLYAGAAPGLPGYLQVNARVPGGIFPPGAAPVELQVAGIAGPAITLWIK